MHTFTNFSFINMHEANIMQNLNKYKLYLVGKLCSLISDFVGKFGFAGKCANVSVSRQYSQYSLIAYDRIPQPKIQE